MQDVVAVGHFTVIVRWKKEILATLALIRADVADVSDVVEPETVNDSEYVRRYVDDQRADFGVEPENVVDGLGVAAGKSERESTSDSVMSTVWLSGPNVRIPVRIA